jgi:hypothetical protein
VNDVEMNYCIRTVSFYDLLSDGGAAHRRAHWPHHQANGHKIGHVITHQEKRSTKVNIIDISSFNKLQYAIYGQEVEWSGVDVSLKYARTSTSRQAVEQRHGTGRFASRSRD